MRKNILLTAILIFTISGFATLTYLRNKSQADNYGAPPYIDESPSSAENNFGKYGNLSNWTRPEGPLRVGLQAGHYLNNELPDELSNLRGTSVGTRRGEVTEWEVNLSIAQKTKEFLEQKGIVVDIIPATVPSGYIADAFVAIHADGNTNRNISGFKVSPPRRDLSGKSIELSKVIHEIYEAGTGFNVDPVISRNMTGYYAFNWRRYEHSIHPMTPAVILETGFMTNSQDARILINSPEIPSKALSEAILKFLNI